MLQEANMEPHVVVALVFALAVLSALSAASVGVAVAFAQSWQKASTAFTELRSWYKGHAEQRSVEALMRDRIEREIRRSHSQPPLPAGKRLGAPAELPPEPSQVKRDAEPISSKPAPLDETWPSGRGPLPQPHSGIDLKAELKAKFLAAVAPLPPTLPEPGAVDWDDLAVKTVPPTDLTSKKTIEVTDSMLVLANAEAVAANDGEPVPLVKLLEDKATVVWPRRQPTKADVQ
jgi:hypothetical protein